MHVEADLLTTNHKVSLAFCFIFKIIETINRHGAHLSS